MAPLRRWRPGGHRLGGATPHDHGGALAFVAARRADRVDGPIDEAALPHPILDLPKQR